MPGGDDEEEEGAAFFGNGPEDLEHRAVTDESATAEQKRLRKELKDKIVSESERMAETILHNGRRVGINRLFSTLKQFERDGSTAALWPDGAASPRLFGPVPQLPGIQRMVHLNEPLQYNSPATLNRVISVVVRTLHRMVNDRVLRRALGDAPADPDGAFQARDDDVQPITKRVAAERFIHLSQRANWSENTLNYALEHLDEDVKLLKAKLGI